MHLQLHPFSYQYPLKRSLQVQLAKKPSFRTDNQPTPSRISPPVSNQISRISQCQMSTCLTSCFAARRADRGSATWYLLRNLQSILRMASSPTSCSLCLRLHLARLHGFTASQLHGFTLGCCCLGCRGRLQPSCTNWSRVASGR